ncbi:hypothetical protein PoB_001693300 [Plakobranchus ocellatus]|uniref:Uncharacterized protein n=1 Tax=Plakobranchus ocellatus TaxID=259542 RepID=A0AAV3Z7J1_9GAST|nr:hypothetical protein PoB_001693300 [Plakobranchus ocellatus]
MYEIIETNPPDHRRLRRSKPETAPDSHVRLTPTETLYSDSSLVAFPSLFNAETFQLEALSEPCIDYLLSSLWPHASRLPSTAERKNGKNTRIRLELRLIQTMFSPNSYDVLVTVISEDGKLLPEFLLVQE